MILSIDTSTREAGISLVKDGVPNAELSWEAGGHHSQTLTVAIETLLRMSASALERISAIVVATGPGSFSGLRVGISEGKGLAMALDVPMVGVSTLDAIALQSLCLSSSVFAALPAGRGQVYGAQYEGDWSTVTRLSEYMILEVEQAASIASGLVAGEAASDVIAARRGPGAWLPPSPWRLRRAAFLAELGNRYLEAGGRDQRDSLEPLYLRRSAAEEKRMGSSH